MDEIHSKKNSAKDILMRIATRQLDELIEHYKCGFAAYEIDGESMEEIKRAASGLWEALNDANFHPVNKKAHYAKRDKNFQQFMKKIQNG